MGPTASPGTPGLGPRSNPKGRQHHRGNPSPFRRATTDLLSPGVSDAAKQSATFGNKINKQTDIACRSSWRPRSRAAAFSGFWLSVRSRDVSPAWPARCSERSQTRALWNPRKALRWYSGKPGRRERRRAASGRGGAGECFRAGTLLGERSPYDGSMRWSISPTRVRPRAEMLSVCRPGAG